MIKQAFNKYNPVELISQLVTVLEQEGLEDEALAVRELSRTINQAWMQRKVSTMNLVKKANLLIRKHLAAGPKTTITPEEILQKTYGQDEDGNPLKVPDMESLKEWSAVHARGAYHDLDDYVFEWPDEIIDVLRKDLQAIGDISEDSDLSKKANRSIRRKHLAAGNVDHLDDVTPSEGSGQTNLTEEQQFVVDKLKEIGWLTVTMQEADPGKDQVKLNEDGTVMADGWSSLMDYEYETETYSSPEEWASKHVGGKDDWWYMAAQHGGMASDGPDPEPYDSALEAQVGRMIEDQGGF